MIYEIIYEKLKTLWHISDRQLGKYKLLFKLKFNCIYQTDKSKKIKCFFSSGISDIYMNDF